MTQRISGHIMSTTLQGQCSRALLGGNTSMYSTKSTIEMAQDMKSFLEIKDRKNLQVSNEDWLVLLRSRATAGLPAYMNFEIVSVNDSSIHASMLIGEHHMAANGFIHAASLITLADTTCGFGCFSKLPKGATGFTTIELKTNFLGTSKAGALLTCEARLVHGGRTTQVWDATITDSTTKSTLALFRCTELIMYPKPTTTTTPSN
ncbi:hypothetical protein SAMD00019534_001110 [Acytostelium subglobosum LB1]|uniref:hypothetical protein n=1 Tax=Acytostelium subglobosum LB1 TaxID=1410327 RepID=UPI0006452127|nr:hypothetical protein SAMD00019534_001110 [Acytostelium subglobosum LB1]GAM16936.1 hypothetical protein SAMD00019534_001110 [Acytostelium subglobosum LB1]|eukprot:XP_012758998.1 hypothetical protein SAMD00019534_001110 [Acytostelium subglobosum LB1]